jgi:hypothetical protein
MGWQRCWGREYREGEGQRSDLSQGVGGCWRCSRFAQLVVHPIVQAWWLVAVVDRVELIFRGPPGALAAPLGRECSTLRS